MAFLEREVGAPALRARLTSLLQAVEESEGFLETPAHEIGDIDWRELEDALTGVRRSVPEEGEALLDRSGERIGPYRLLRRLGRGGMASVYLAERADGHWEQRVAVKVIRRGVDTEDVVRRFLAERQILSSLDHPHIARLLDGGATGDDLPYLVMEYVDGTPLTRFADERALGIDARLELFRDVAAAVGHAHSNLVVHRDLKPSNILVTAEGTPKLLDFGIAKLLEPSGSGAPTHAGRRVLTPGYASPEQLRGDPIGTASDVYQLGVLLCVLLSGERPFPRADDGAGRVIPKDEGEHVEPSRLVTGAAAGDRGLSAGDLRRRLSGDLDTIVLKAVEHRPADRYRSVDALIADIDRHLEGRPIAARPRTLALRARKWIGRNPVLAAAAAAVVALLVGWAATASLQFRAVERERDRVARENARATATRDFLLGLFDLSDPYEAGRSADSVSARELLDAGARRLDRDLAAHPETRADIARTIGTTYRNAGLYGPAIAMLERSLALYERLRGERSPEVAQSLHDLASVVRHRDGDSAFVLMRRALMIGEAALRPDDPALARILIEFSTMASARIGLSEDSVRALQDRAISILRSDPEVRGELAGALATSSYGRRDSVGDARMREALAIRRELYGDRHPRVGESLSDLALRVEHDDPLRADSLLVLAVDILEGSLGPAHAVTLTVTNNLAGVRRDRGAWEGAAELYSRILDLRREHYPESSVAIAYPAFGLGLSLLELGRLERAETHLRAARGLLARSVDRADVRLLRTTIELARCLRLQGGLPEAESLLSEALEAARSADAPQELVDDVLEALRRVESS